MQTSGNNSLPEIDQRSTISFGQKRALFDDKYNVKNSNGCREYRKQKHSPVRKWTTGRMEKQPENGKFPGNN